MSGSERDRPPDPEGADREQAGYPVDGGISDRVGELAQALLANPVVNQAMGTAFGARDKAMGAQRVAMEALDIPSASDLERLERRLRALSDRVEEAEGEVDRLAAEVRSLRESRGAGED